MYSCCYRLVNGVYYCYRFNSTHRRAAFMSVVPGPWIKGLPGPVRWEYRDKFTERGRIVK